VKEGHCANFGAVGAHTKMPCCSLYKDHRVQVREGAIKFQARHTQARLAGKMQT